MSLKQLSLHQIIIRHVNTPYKNLTEKLDKDIFTRGCSGYEREQLVRRLIFFALANYSTDMFDELTLYCITLLKGMKYYDDYWFITTPIVHINMKEEKVTKFLFELYAFKGVVSSGKIPQCSEEYRMFVGL